jgi:hypothetical protein
LKDKRIDELVMSLNRAAEAAVPMGRDLLVSAVHLYNECERQKNPDGRETSVTNFCRKNARAAG